MLYLGARFCSPACPVDARAKRGHDEVYDSTRRNRRRIKCACGNTTRFGIPEFPVTFQCTKCGGRQTVIGYPWLRTTNSRRRTLPSSSNASRERPHEEKVIGI